MLVLLSCGGNAPDHVPTTSPDVRGYVTNIKRTASNGSGATAVVLLESLEDTDTKHQQVSIRIDAHTLVEDGEGAPMQIEQLREGHAVEAWLEDDQLKSAGPVQGTAKAIRIKQ
ncbi:DUF3221 domain-containing protein [Pontibacter chitinilyticus]|uniref:DUF3221 domain-containing protein n=1 Tax=Pontibacter chitinilyticus TaxID=2674989 RepID=UPI00321A0889